MYLIQVLVFISLTKKIGIIIKKVLKFLWHLSILYSMRQKQKYYQIAELKRSWRLSIFNHDGTLNQKCYLSTRASAVNLAGVLTNWQPNEQLSTITTKS